MNAQETFETPTVIKFDAQKRVKQIIELKDKIKVLEDGHKEELRPYKEMVSKLEALILGHLGQINAQNISTPVGTVSVLHRKSASLEDPAAFMEYVISNEAWDLMDRKANAKAVEDFIGENNSPPPGVKFSDAITLGVRRK
jgi:hypothetical protein